MKNQKGISMITLVITIIVLIILAAIVINFAFRNTVDETAFTRKVSEMTEVYDAVVQRGIEHGLDGTMYPYAGTKLTDSNPLEIDGVKYGDGYYYIETDADKSALKLERVAGNYIVNYETGDIVSQIKIEYEGKNYYRLADVSGAVQPTGSSTTVGEYNIDKGVNEPILSDGMVPVLMNGSTWIVANPDDYNWYNYERGKYATVMLMDELEVEGYTNEEIRGMSRSELANLVGLDVIVPGSTFIWIPRYTYKEEGGNKRIVYSHLLEDYTENGYVKEPAFYFGQYVGANSATDKDANTGYIGGGKELPGIWVSKYESGYDS